MLLDLRIQKLSIFNKVNSGINNPPKNVEVAIDGALDLRDEDKPQPTRMSRRLWAELEQRAR